MAAGGPGMELARGGYESCPYHWQATSQSPWVLLCLWWDANAQHEDESRNCVLSHRALVTIRSTSTLLHLWISGGGWRMPTMLKGLIITTFQVLIDAQ